jgi:hypothetical protein
MKLALKLTAENALMAAAAVVEDPAAVAAVKTTDADINPFLNADLSFF